MYLGRNALVRLIRISFWFLATIVIAYFLTDIKISGKTIKGHIDSLLGDRSGSHLKDKANELLDQYVRPSLETVPIPSLRELENKERKEGEELTPKEQSRLKEIIEEAP